MRPRPLATLAVVALLGADARATPSFSELAPAEGADVGLPVVLSGLVSSDSGLSQVSLLADWSGAWEVVETRSWTDAPPELLANGAFETFADGLAEGWALQTDGSVDVAVAQDGGASGGSSQRIEVRSPGSWGLFLYQRPPIEVGADYLWRLRYRTSPGASVWAQVTDARHSRVVLRQELEPTDDAWREVELPFTWSDPGADMVRLAMADVGTLWLDDASLRPAVVELPREATVSFVQRPPFGRWSWALSADDGATAESERQTLVVAHPDHDGWRVLPIRSREEHEAGLVGGEAEQHNQGIARSRSHPDIIYLSHDCGQVWRSVDDGRTWRKRLGRGLFALAGQSIEVDPVDPDVVLTVHDESWDYLNAEYQGVYRSRDGGDTWDFVLPGPVGNSRRYEHDLVFDPASVGAGGAARWYVALYAGGGEGAALHRSEDRGVTWSRGASLAGHDPVFGLAAHPTDGRSVYVASAAGLHVSRDRGATLVPLGDLPAGPVSSLVVDPRDADVVLAVLRESGLYRSGDGGQRFDRVAVADPELARAADSAVHVFANPGYPDVLYLVGSDTRQSALRSGDGGVTWASTALLPPAGLDRGYKTRMIRELTGVVPDPRDPDSAVAFTRAALWRTTDDGGGLVFADSSTLYTGFNCAHWNENVAFDADDPDRFALGNADVGMTITHNRGAWFERRGVPTAWREGPDAPLPWTSMVATSFQPRTRTILSSAGYVWEQKLVRSVDEGVTWEIVDDEAGHNLFVAFHPGDPQVVYAGHKRSLDGGRTFAPIPFLTPYAGDAEPASLVGMCLSDPDVVYAITRPRDDILRSDDRGETWRVYATADWTFTPHDTKPTFAAHPTDCDRVYTIDATGDLASFDGERWQGLGVLALAGARQPRNFVRAVAVDPGRPEVIYAGMHASGVDGVWRSRDEGATWEDVTWNRPRLPVSGLLVSPHSGEVSVGSCFGTWVLPPPYPSPDRLYDSLVPMPSCHDGLDNGDEEGVDCGGGCPVACPVEPPEPDAGAGEDVGGLDARVDAGTEVDAGPRPDATAGPDAPQPPARPDADDGCGCRLSPGGRLSSWLGSPRR